MDNFMGITLAVLAIVVTAIVLANYLFAGRFDSNIDTEVQFIELKVSNQAYTVEIADTPALREKGLMNRESLPQNLGMLFVFDYNGFHGFWMKNTLIPLDMIWINEQKEVVYIYENAQPCSNLIEAVCNSIIPTKMAKYVLELNAGEANNLGLQTGDKVEFNLKN